MSKQRFELKEDHLKLLKVASWYWDDCEFGAPAMHPKKPFGNSDVIDDIKEILDVEKEKCPHCNCSLKCYNCEEDIIGPNAKSDECYDKLYRELEIALEVVFNSQSFEVGMYEDQSDKYMNPKWEFIGK